MQINITNSSVRHAKKVIHTEREKKSLPFGEILSKESISRHNVNSRANMIFLPKHASSHPSRSIHNGRHTNSYSNKVAKEMDDLVQIGKSAGWTQKQYNAQTKKLLSELRQELRAGNVGLNKLHRPWATKW